MLISRENKKLEAIKRLKLLGVYPETITQFENENLLSVSMPPPGAFFWVDSETEECVKQFESEYNAPVYLIVRSYTIIGRMDSYFHVNDYKNKWVTENQNLQNSGSLVYVQNNDDKLCSEFGYIGFKLTIAQSLVCV